MRRLCAWIVALGLLLCGCSAAGEDRAESIRAKLLEEALDSVGVCSAEEAVDVWARGLMARNAALQYAVMDAPLRKQYTKALKTTAPSWVTGVSSPWVSGYSVFDIDETEEGLRLYSLYVMTETSAGPEKVYLAVLSVQQNGSYWRIAGICADEGLSAYTGFLQ